VPRLRGSAGVKRFGNVGRTCSRPGDQKTPEKRRFHDAAGRAPPLSPFGNADDDAFCRVARRLHNGLRGGFRA
jgi:hypothetical protein